MERWIATLAIFVLTPGCNTFRDVEPVLTDAETSADTTESDLDASTTTTAEETSSDDAVTEDVPTCTTEAGEAGVLCGALCCGAGESCDASTGIPICSCGGRESALGQVCGAGELCDANQECRCGLRANRFGRACGEGETCVDNTLCTCGDTQNQNGFACLDARTVCDPEAQACVCRVACSDPVVGCCGTQETCNGEFCACDTIVASEVGKPACINGTNCYDTGVCGE